MPPTIRSDMLVQGKRYLFDTCKKITLLLLRSRDGPLCANYYICSDRIHANGSGCRYFYYVVIALWREHLVNVKKQRFDPSCPPRDKPRHCDDNILLLAWRKQPDSISITIIETAFLFTDCWNMVCFQIYKVVEVALTDDNSSWVVVYHVPEMQRIC